MTTEPPYLPEPVVDGLEMAFPVRKLAALYMENGWPIALDGKRLEDPTPEKLAAVLAGIIEMMIADPEAKSAVGFRLMAVRDADYPGDLDFYMYVGRATTHTPEVDDQ
ncbi:hypothetical protein [Micromonospora andamanensis]|uniref:hypothetical protein n=1 Tax=Micromonospora andamanensis TaxID=1287068 RepID=UPI001951BCD3|nr:hypothetical protein [Micromonospora andamanensis]